MQVFRAVVETCDQSLPPKVWGARIGPRSNAVEGNASIPAAEMNMLKIFCTSRQWARPFRPELKMNRLVEKVYLAGRLGPVGTVSPRSNSL